ncbi:hypothetical protein OPV22_004446 [Ensete ventricosum]|uniref:Uncharacterized protein n=1 Tax=Ensete ventricosum TaxID=4639 RepID=A0AAV8S3T5_ENSVE|nr:hypothetical protein OPV22_004446 [Ensete ventricosum]
MVMPGWVFPRLPIIVACTGAPFSEFEAEVRSQKQLCKVAALLILYLLKGYLSWQPEKVTEFFSESICLGVEETIFSVVHGLLATSL